MTTATIVLCTHNRAGLIARAVTHALAEARSADADVLVVDNASTDATPNVVAGLAHEAKGRVRLVHEAVLGLSAARNHGLAESRGAVAAFLDDDATPRPGWLRALLAPYDDPAVACVGGRVVLRFEAPPPPWLTVALHPTLSAYDAGDAPRRLRYRPGDEFPYGANISYRVAAARARGGFSTRIGVTGARLLGHEETDLCFRLDRAGHEIRYAPDAIVDHWVLPERLSPRWFVERHRTRGESSALFELRNRGLHRAMGRVRWHYGRHLLARPYAPAEPVDAERLATECQRQEALGYLIGLVRALPHLRALRAEAAS